MLDDVVDLPIADRRASLDVFSADGVLPPPPIEPMASSKGLPGVLGVLAEPNAAKAPDPSPKALEAPPVAEGDVRPPPGVVELKGFERPWEEVGPFRRREE